MVHRPLRSLGWFHYTWPTEDRGCEQLIRLFFQPQKQGRIREDISQKKKRAPPVADHQHLWISWLVSDCNFQQALPFTKRAQYHGHTGVATKSQSTLVISNYLIPNIVTAGILLWHTPPPSWAYSLYLLHIKQQKTRRKCPGKRACVCLREYSKSYG